MFGNKSADILARLERLEQQLSRVEGKLDQLLGANHAPAHDPQLEEVRRLAQSGQKIQAIKRYRELTGLGLKDAKEAVEAMVEPSASAW